jgi:hypothetical protein
MSVNISLKLCGLADGFDLDDVRLGSGGDSGGSGPSELGNNSAQGDRLGAGGRLADGRLRGWCGLEADECPEVCPGPDAGCGFEVDDGLGSDNDLEVDDGSTVGGILGVDAGSRPDVSSRVVSLRADVNSEEDRPPLAGGGLSSFLGVDGNPRVSFVVDDNLDEGGDPGVGG